MNISFLILGTLAAICWMITIFVAASFMLFATGGPWLMSPLLTSNQLFTWIAAGVALIPAIFIIIITVRMSRKRK